MKINFPYSLLVVVCFSAFFSKVSADKKSGEFDAFASLIVWTARESGADCWAEVITADGLASSNVLEPVHFKWDPGFKVGLGYEQNKWDTQIYYTWFYTRAKDSVSSVPGTVHSTFTGNFYIDNVHGEGISGPAYQKASIDWTIRFNMFDWELGRNFCMSKSINFRPFLGVKGGWIHQSINTTWYNPDLSTLAFFGSPYYSYGKEKLKNNFWGVGPQAGIDSKWFLVAKQSQFFYLFGDFSGAIMWGHWSFGDIYKNTIDQQVFVDFSPLNYGASMVKSFMGFGWDGSFSQDRFHITLKVGYEAQFWLDQLQFYSFVGGRLANALTLQGGTLEFCFAY